MDLYPTPYADDVPTFNGQPIFGDLSSFAVAPLPFNTAAAIDTFLGFTPGTTFYGADASGHLWGITGALVADSSGGVAAMRATLLSFAGPAGRLNIPTYLRFPADYQWVPNCYFVAAEFVPSPGGIVPIGGGMYNLGYALVVREIHG